MNFASKLKYVGAAAIAAAVAYGGFPVSATETKGPVTDEIGVVKINKDDPIVIGAYLVISGPDLAVGVDEQRAIEIAFDEAGNQLLGHPIKLVVEDSTCSAEGGQTAAVKLASNQQVSVVVGPSCSSASVPGAPILWKAGIPSIGLNSVTSVTAPDRDPGYYGYLRTCFNDSWSAVADSNYAYNVVGHRTATLLHEGTSYSESVARLFGEAFEKLGGKVLSTEAVGPKDVEMRPALTRIATDAPEVLYMPLNVFAAGHVVRQAKEVSGLGNTMLLGQNSLFSRDMISAAGDAVVGFKMAIVDLSGETFSDHYPVFLDTYVEKYGEHPPQAYHYLAYDAALVAMAAIRKVAVKDDTGNTYIGRKALRDALYATKGLKGLSGDITCNEHGDCGVYHGAIYEFTDSDPASWKPGVNPKKIYP